jgi:hypothetical protein
MTNDQQIAIAFRALSGKNDLTVTDCKNWITGLTFDANSPLTPTEGAHSFAICWPDPFDIGIDGRFGRIKTVLIF